MEYIYMVKIYYYSDEKLLDVELHGAFTSYRDASEFLVNEEFEVYYDNDTSEMLKEESIGFYYSDDIGEQDAIIEKFVVFAL
jgi:hypothetical protein